MRQNRIKHAMQACNKGKDKPEWVTVIGIAKALKVEPNTVYRWMSSESEPSVKDLHKIAALLGVKARDLIANAEIPQEQYFKMRKICDEWNPCELGKKEFREWLRIDQYGILQEETQYVSDELLSLLISHEEYEKAAIVRDELKKQKNMSKVKKVRSGCALAVIAAIVLGPIVLGIIKLMAFIKYIFT